MIVGGGPESQDETPAVPKVVKLSLIPLGVLTLRSGTVAKVGLVAGRRGELVVPTLLVEPHSLVLFQLDHAQAAYRTWKEGVDPSAPVWPKAPSWTDFKLPDLNSLRDLHEWGRRRDARRAQPRDVDAFWSASTSRLEALYDSLPVGTDARRGALQALWARQPWIFCTPAFHPSRFSAVLVDEWPVADLPACEAAFAVSRGSPNPNPFQRRQGHPHRSVVEPDPWLFYEALAAELPSEHTALVRRFVAAGCGKPHDPAGLDETFRRVRQTGLKRQRRGAVPRSMFIPVGSARGRGDDDAVLLRWLRSDQALRCLEALAGGDIEAYSLPLAGGSWMGFQKARHLPFWRDRDAPGEAPATREPSGAPSTAPEPEPSAALVPEDPADQPEMGHVWAADEPPFTIWKREWCEAAGFATTAFEFWSSWLAGSLGVDK